MKKRTLGKIATVINPLQGLLSNTPEAPQILTTELFAAMSTNFMITPVI